MTGTCTVNIASDAASSDLVDLALHAAGGLDRWSSIGELTARLHIGGTMWGRRGHPDGLGITTAVINVDDQQVRYAPFLQPELTSLYTPQHVAILRDGTVVAERDQPREAVLSHAGATWDRLDVAYFSGYALWNYLTMPWLLARSDVVTTELGPWTETSAFTGGEPQTWRRLAVTFPSAVTTHNREQVFYYDSIGRQRRHDYAADVFNGVPTAHYTGGHRHVDGLLLPTQRHVVPRRHDGTTTPAPVLVSIDVLDLTIAQRQP